MSSPLSPQALYDALVAEGCTVVGLPGWEWHNRNAATGKGFAPNGTMTHHTGSDTGDERAYAAGILWEGRAGLPGPLCTGGIGASGTVYLTGWGRANHAGSGDPAVLSAVIAEADWLDAREASPSSNTEDGNSRYYGWEVMYSGYHPMAEAQYVATVRVNAAICRAHGWTERSCIGHREWTNQKWDPGACPMTTLRADIAACLALPAGQWRSHVTPPPKPEPPQEDDDMFRLVASVPAEGSKVYALVPGKPKRWLTPDEYGLLARVFPAQANLPGSPFFESQIDQINAILQPAGPVAVKGLLAGPESGGATLDLVPRFAADAAPPCTVDEVE